VVCTDELLAVWLPDCVLVAVSVTDPVHDPDAEFVWVADIEIDGVALGSALLVIDDEQLAVILLNAD
jgi:hypothetical protein